MLLHLDKRADRIFPKLTQQANSQLFAKLGWNWCGIPRLSPHTMRTYYCCEAVNNPDVEVADYPALASRLQVSVDTMNSVYAAPSLRGPAIQLAFKLHNTVDENSTEQKQQPAPKRQKVEEPATEVSSNQQMLQQMQLLMQQQHRQHQEHMANIENLNCKPDNVLPAVEMSVTSENSHMVEP
jgi:hypothetical protein